MSGPRVLIVTPWYLPLLGGQERQAALLADAFARMGYDVDVLTEHADPTSPRREQQGRVRVTRVRTTSVRRPWTYPLVAAGMLAFLLRNRRSYRFAVIRTLTLPAFLVGVLKALRLVRYPTLVTAETGGDADDVIALRGYPLFPLLRAVVAQHDVLNGICADNLRHYRELGFPEHKLTRIYNGVDTSPYARLAFPERVRIFGFLGRLHHEKGVHELLQAFGKVHERHEDVRLLVAGDGPEESALRSYAAAHGLDGAIEFAGRIPYEELGAFFERIDALVLPSYSEGLPLSVLEAAAHKRLIVATDVSDLRELFGDSVFFCAKRDPADLEAQMEVLTVRTGAADPSYDVAIAQLAIDEVAQRIAARVRAGGRV
jgi:glycosyltransferase involved in cell wall biosynthesis